jgi:HEAT repeat protein
MIQAGLDPEPHVSQAAQLALFNLPEGRTDRILTARLESSDSARRLLIIDVLARRRASEAQEELLALTDHEDLATRVAALKALGNVLTPVGWPSLVACLVQASTTAERQAADAALETACARFDNRAACAGPLATALPAANQETRILLLRRLGQVGGPLALATVREYTLAGTPEPLRDTAIQVITEWPDTSAMPDLQAMLEPAAATRALYRTLAFHGFVRLVHESQLSAEMKVEYLQFAMVASAGDQETKRILQALGSVASPRALEMALSQLGRPELAQAASLAVLQISTILDTNQYRSALEAALKTVVQNADDPATVRKARRRLQELQE